MTASDLTPRDRAVLEQLLAGRTAKQIAGEAGYPQNTLSYRLHRLKKRIGLRSIIQLGAWCEQQGIKGKPLPLARDRGCAASDPQSFAVLNINSTTRVGVSASGDHQ